MHICICDLWLDLIYFFFQKMYCRGNSRLKWICRGGYRQPPLQIIERLVRSGWTNRPYSIPIAPKNACCSSGKQARKHETRMHLQPRASSRSFLRHAPLPVKLRPHPSVWKAWTVASRCGAARCSLTSGGPAWPQRPFGHRARITHGSVAFLQTSSFFFHLI